MEHGAWRSGATIGTYCSYETVMTLRNLGHGCVRSSSILCSAQRHDEHLDVLCAIDNTFRMRLRRASVPAILGRGLLQGLAAGGRRHAHSRARRGTQDGVTGKASAGLVGPPSPRAPGAAQRSPPPEINSSHSVSALRPLAERATAALLLPAVDVATVLSHACLLFFPSLEACRLFPRSVSP